MRIASSSTLSTILDTPMLRMRLAYSWPKPRCCVCGTSAQGVFEIHFHVRERLDENGEDISPPDWIEYRLGCHSCFTSDFGRGVRPQAELPKAWPPFYARRKTINFILAITCISNASKAMQEVLS